MALSYYSTTRPAALSVAMNSSTTTVPLVSAATFPDPAGPGNSEYSIIVGYGTDREEICTVTAKAGDTLTVIRGQDSTAATAKNQGDTVVHGVSARDFKSFVLNTDSRLTDARTPVVHAASHATGGSDPVTTAAIGAATMAQVNAAIAAVIPIGTIVVWYGSFASIPAGWRLCDGGGGTPNLTNRFIVGAGASYAVGGTGGADTVALAVAHLPSHAHGGGTGFAGSHAHASAFQFYSDFNNVNQDGALAPFGSGPRNVTVYGAGTNQDMGGGEHNHAIPYEGSGAAHENRPPFYALAYIMKVT